MYPKTIVRVGVIVFLALCIIFVAVGQANGNTQFAQNGKDAAWATHGYTANDGGTQEHRVISLSDNECDDHKAYVNYEIQGNSTRYLLGDADGCSGNRYHRSYVASGRAITWMRVGEYYDGYTHWSAWVRVYSHTWA